MTTGEFETSLDCARALDRRDELASFRGRFEIPQSVGAAAVYLCGHSLGLMPKDARLAVEHELDAWAERAVAAHFGADGGWYAYHERFAEPLAGLLGVDAAGVVSMNSLTVNLHLMLVSFFRPLAARRKIVIERSAFPSDRYAVQSHLHWHGLDPQADLIELEPAPGNAHLEPGDLERLLAEHPDQVALVLLPGVQFLTGQALPLTEFTMVAKQHGAITGFDLAHSIGNVARPLAGCDADFAVWCGYKYLNGGPGAIGGAYVHPRWHDAGLPRFEGWWGHAKDRRFLLEERFAGTGTAEAWQLSNPPIFAMAPLASSLDLFEEAGMDRLRAKSRLQAAYLEWLLEALCGERCSLLSPSAPDARGCQISIRLDLGELPAASFVERLAAARIVVDWRKPDVLRLAPTPLYNSFEDIHRAITAIAATLAA